VEAKDWLPWNWFRKKSLDRTALINAATAYARSQGYSVDKDYVMTAARKSNGNFWVLFEGKSKLPGDHFSVLVDGKTGKVIRLFPGA